MATTVVIFSKDRPWQLSEYLRTFYKHCSGIYNFVVLWKSDKYREQYLDVIKHYSDSKYNAKFIEESEFYKDITNILNNIEYPYTMFGVDDVLWYDYFDIFDGERTLEQYPDIHVYSYRLHTNIKFCQPANVFNTIPTFEAIKYGYSYNRSYGGGDFNYPFEVSASLYRTSDIKNIIVNLDKFNNPNELEDRLQFSTLHPQYHRNAFNGRRVCSTITINRVQEQYKNPTYDAGVSLDIINNWFGHYQFDTSKYATELFDRIHIGDFFVRQITN